jgi:hypothetical protein
MFRIDQHLTAIHQDDLAEAVRARRIEKALAPCKRCLADLSQANSRISVEYEGSLLIHDVFLNEDFPCSFLLLINYCLGLNPRKSSDHQSTHVNTFFSMF